MWKPAGSLAAAVLSRPWLAISSFIPNREVLFILFNYFQVHLEYQVLWLV